MGDGEFVTALENHKILLYHGTEMLPDGTVKEVHRASMHNKYRLHPKPHPDDMLVRFGDSYRDAVEKLMMANNDPDAPSYSAE